MNKTGYKYVTRRGNYYRASCKRKDISFEKSGFLTAKEAYVYAMDKLKNAHKRGAKIDVKEFLERKSEVDGKIVSKWECADCWYGYDEKPDRCKKCNCMRFLKIEHPSRLLNNRKAEYKRSHK